MTAAASKILIMTAVAAERDAVLRGLRGDARFDVLEAGVGPVEAAVGAATALALAGDGAYRLVISAGIAGGFVGRAAVGSLVVASELIAADLGAETPEGFRRVDELGFGSAAIAADAELAARLAKALRASGLETAHGPILTLSTVTGTAETAEALAARVPGACAEAMEGFGIAAAARRHGLPALELRAISNPVGPRDRSAWRIKEALQSLEAASAVLLEVID
ncbi:futalosine hydrolase [Paenibacillus sp. NEAU-GSW1]|uniref:futalosine hydrolase n=1 Tax=Paenibacillus sp. NEAU-GSW1 TaxID=2682486 RepID=UPI0012E252D7|nr:futalosine hydrolase [Paenibacillus sp. NEAU-GSW1]MUT64780.1 futalosine hydrolase [Paenibacillus sp. NEAU-GSW1]